MPDRKQRAKTTRRQIRTRRADATIAMAPSKCSASPGHVIVAEPQRTRHALSWSHNYSRSRYGTILRPLLIDDPDRMRLIRPVDSQVVALQKPRQDIRRRINLCVSTASISASESASICEAPTEARPPATKRHLVFL